MVLFSRYPLSHLTFSLLHVQADASAASSSTSTAASTSGSRLSAVSRGAGGVPPPTGGAAPEFFDDESDSDELRVAAVDDDRALLGDAHLLLAGYRGALLVRAQTTEDAQTSTSSSGARSGKKLRVMREEERVRVELGVYGAMLDADQPPRRGRAVPRVLADEGCVCYTRCVWRNAVQENQLKYVVFVFSPSIICLWSPLSSHPLSFFDPERPEMSESNRALLEARLMREDPDQLRLFRASDRALLVAPLPTAARPVRSAAGVALTREESAAAAVWERALLTRRVRATKHMVHS